MQKYIILDVPSVDDQRVVSRLREEFHCTPVSGKEVSSQLVEEKFWEKFPVATTLLVFPGNGAGIVREYLPRNWLARWQWMTVTAKRVWIPGEAPRAIVGRIANSMLLGFSHVIVMDDVVSSGVTIRNIRQTNSPWIPNTRWVSVSWIAQRSAGTRGFAQVHAGLFVGDERRKAPINSLSTLLCDEAILRSYARRNFEGDATFISFMQEIKKQGV